MQETICFAWGASSLGDFLIATTSLGIVALEFGEDRIAMETALRARFPEAIISERPDVLEPIRMKVTRAIEEPGYEPDVPLDLRGTPYEVKVWRMLREIPAGETTNYGALAARLGTRDARDVTTAIASNTIAVLVPCHRVIKKDGTISGYRWGFQRKRTLLARERGLHKGSGSSRPGAREG
ncbi:methylated-DNA--[protein]-cysteine S-methyltransferase [Sphingomonas sp. PR090111-T3T-6A]|uniref:methylated-DNA--[protein]-cysteine S-methyltransferase n=1 Tax=Sphingomonas sp. PR090111-T3T-6A TaxID=685778 RepID=UPI000369E8C8|nr:methylated-DNA--[protein]-cysteine S-methyltransferase [Sphingomonas sp. PR090111-T3T-6A]